MTSILSDIAVVTSVLSDVAVVTSVLSDIPIVTSILSDIAVVTSVLLLFQISWVAKVRETSDETEDVALSSQLVKTAGTALCPGRQEFCFFDVSLVNDDVSI